jgi:hypothetical protein
MLQRAPLSTRYNTDKNNISIPIMGFELEISVFEWVDEHTPFRLREVKRLPGLVKLMKQFLS